jgi:LPS export ABC transporter permease LptF
MRILSRYFLRELVFPFFLALGIISFLLLMNKLLTLVDLILKYGVGLWTVVKLVAYIVPATFAITVPMSLLFAVLMAFGRMAADMEFTALKAGGISLPSLFFPLVVLGLGMSFSMLLFNEFVLPRANLAYKTLFFDILRSRSNVLIQEGVYVRDFEGFVLRVNHKDKADGRLENVLLYLLPQGQSPLQLVTARWGRLVSDPNSLRVYLELHQGSLQAVGQKDPLQMTQLFFDTDVVDIDIHGEMERAQKRDRRPDDMTIAETRARLAQMEPGDPDRWAWEVEMHKKIAIPFACLAFVLVGCPLGTLVRRGGRLLGFLFAMALIFGYYLLLSAGETYASNGRLSAALGMWLPNLMLFLLGLFLTWWVLKEKSLRFPRLWKPA